MQWVNMLFLHYFVGSHHAFKLRNELSFAAYKLVQLIAKTNLWISYLFLPVSTISISQALSLRKVTLIVGWEEKRGVAGIEQDRHCTCSLIYLTY
jgi:hypothetical protein